jgi:excisionase family DNA binding protein
MNSETIEKSFCTTREAAALLGVSVGTVQLWVESGQLQAWKTAGGHRRVMRDSVDSLLRKTPGLPAPLPEVPRRLTVMVVEDDATLLRLYEARISRWPMAPKMIGVDNAFAALLMMGSMNPDLLITDLQMPGMDGFNMLRVLNEAPESAYTTIVVVSGLDAADIEAKGGIPKGIEVLPKPIPFDRLRDIAIGITTAKRLERSAP